MIFPPALIMACLASLTTESGVCSFSNQMMADFLFCSIASAPGRTARAVARRARGFMLMSVGETLSRAFVRFGKYRASDRDG